MNKIFKCYCNNDFDENEFKKHFAKCKPFCNEFKDFDVKMALFLKLHSKTKEDLINLQFLLEQYSNLINFKLTDNNNNIL